MSGAIVRRTLPDDETNSSHEIYFLLGGFAALSSRGGELYAATSPIAYSSMAPSAASRGRSLSLVSGPARARHPRNNLSRHAAATGVGEK